MAKHIMANTLMNLVDCNIEEALWLADELMTSLEYSKYTIKHTMVEQSE